MLTLGNAVCGFGAITFAAKWTNHDTPTSLFVAGCLIFLAMVFDGFDGAAARWTNQTTEFGAQLDSLCDAISFGAAPAILMLELSQPHMYHPRVLWVAAGLYVICTVLRLARYNVESEEDHQPGVFCGLPSPAAAAVVASFPIMLFGPQLLSSGEEWADLPDLDVWVSRILPLITFGVACLMVSKVRYMHMLHRLFRKPRSGAFLIKMVFAAAVVVAVPRVAVPLLACWYAFATPTLALWDRYLRRMLGFGPMDLQPAPNKEPWPRPTGSNGQDGGATGGGTTPPAPPTRKLAPHDSEPR
nr:CDP-diacylglycerol--serine O-phosphatidyltransferase [Fimbriiglobus ruber]